MRNLLDQPALKLIECTGPNLALAELPALVRFECTVKLPKTNRYYRKLHDIVRMRFGSRFNGESDGVNFELATPVQLSAEEIREVEQVVSREVSNVSTLRKFNLLYYQSNVASPRIEVDRIEPIIEPDRSNPLKFDCLFKQVSKPYLIKEYLGKEDNKEIFLFAAETRLDAFVKGKNVKFEKLKVEPLWVNIAEAQAV